jgi:hypothetical protein
LPTRTGRGFDKAPLEKHKRWWQVAFDIEDHEKSVNKKSLVTGELLLTFWQKKDISELRFTF